MAFAINFSRIQPNYAQRCCKISQHPQLRNFSALHHGKKCFSFVVQGLQRYLFVRKTKRLQLLHEFENLHKNLKAIDNLWEEVTEKGDLQLDKVREERFSFRDEFECRDRFFSNEMMKLFQSSAEVEKVIEIGQIFGKLQSEWFPYFPMENNPQRAIIIASIQKRIIELDAVITGGNPKPDLYSTQYDVERHIRERWDDILKETYNPRAKRLVALLDASDINHGYFTAALSRFFSESPDKLIDELTDESTDKNYEVPHLTEFELDEIKFAVQPQFSEDYYQGEYEWCAFPGWHCALKCVTDILMKPSTEFTN